MEFIQPKQDSAYASSLNRNGGINTKLDKLIDILSNREIDKESKKEDKSWKFPFKWKRTMNKSARPSKEERVLCFFVNIKGELEPPVLLPIHNGNTITYKYTVHEVDPRDILTLPYKKKIYKLLIYDIANRKAFSVRDYQEIKDNKGSTMDDEVLIKAMLTAKASQISTAQIGKGALIIGGLVLVGIIIWLFLKK